MKRVKVWPKGSTWLTLGHGLSGGELGLPLLRACNSHGGTASEQASAARGCPLAGRDQHDDPLRTYQCFCRLLLALCAAATPETELGECLAVLHTRLGPVLAKGIVMHHEGVARL